LNEWIERSRLRIERDRLNQQIAALVEASLRLVDSTDTSERQHHEVALRRHEQEIRTFRSDLVQFHHRYGPLGE
jgi:hypothetical protein